MEKKHFFYFIRGLIVAFVLMICMNSMVYSHSHFEKDINSIRLVELDLSQQKKTVTGKVVDNTGISLPGVTVMVKGTSVGTITDGNGDFTLQIDFDSKSIVCLC